MFLCFYLIVSAPALYGSSTEFSGISFSRELKTGHSIPIFCDYECSIEWEIIISHDLLAVLLLTQLMKLNPTGEIIFNQLLLEYAPGSLLPKLPCSQACLLLAVISGVTPTQHDFAFAVKNDVVPLGPLLELAVLFLAGCIHQSFSLAQNNQCAVLVGIQIH